MTPIEKIALVIVAISIIKLVVLFINPRAWFNTAGKLLGMGPITTVILLALGYWVLKMLLVEFTIVEIYAVFAFTIIVMWLSLLPYRKKIYDAVTHEMTTKNIMKKAGLTIVIWLGLTIWVLKEIFA